MQQNKQIILGYFFLVFWIAIIVAMIYFVFFGNKSDTNVSTSQNAPKTLEYDLGVIPIVASEGGSFIAEIFVEGIGVVPVKVALPGITETEVPIVLVKPDSQNPEAGFGPGEDAIRESGKAYASFFWPGQTDPLETYIVKGEFGNQTQNDLVYKQVILFLNGEEPERNGYKISELSKAKLGKVE